MHGIHVCIVHPDTQTPAGIALDHPNPGQHTHVPTYSTTSGVWRNVSRTASMFHINASGSDRFSHTCSSHHTNSSCSATVSSGMQSSAYQQSTVMSDQGRRGTQLSLQWSTASMHDCGGGQSTGGVMRWDR